MASLHQQLATPGARLALSSRLKLFRHDLHGPKENSAFNDAARRRLARGFSIPSLYNHHIPVTTPCIDIMMVRSAEVDRLCNQYLQLEPALDFPSGSLLRNADIQEELYHRLFSADALPFPPPLRYQARALKQLLSKIEDSIDDWEEHVSFDAKMT